MLPPSKMMSPSIRTPSIRSFRRLMQRSSVDLPQPEGPMKAVICFSGISIEISFSAFLSPYQSDRSWMRRIGFWMPGSSAGSRPSAVWGSAPPGIGAACVGTVWISAMIVFSLLSSGSCLILPDPAGP